MLPAKTLAPAATPWMSQQAPTTQAKPLLRRLRAVLDRGLHHLHALHALRARDVLVDLLRQRVQRVATLLPALRSRRVERTRDRRRPLGREAVPAHELIEVRPDHHERRRPHDLRLALRVVLAELHELRRLDLVLRQLI